MPITLTVAINHSIDDLPYLSSGVDWIDVSISDTLIFSNGSSTVADGEPIPTESQLTQAGIVISPTLDIIVPHYFLLDSSASMLKEVFLAGNQNQRYVFCAYFDGETASEPVLELWDNTDLNTINDYSLGNGDATSSWWRGVVTTDGLPGADWVGSKLAGSSIGHFLQLNNGNDALSGAKALYFNLKVIVPANFQNSGLEKPVFVIKYTTN
jgi:hypothetical protein